MSTGGIDPNAGATAEMPESIRLLREGQQSFHQEYQKTLASHKAEISQMLGGGQKKDELLDDPRIVNMLNMLRDNPMLIDKVCTFAAGVVIKLKAAIIQELQNISVPVDIDEFVKSSRVMTPEAAAAEAAAKAAANPPS